MSRTLDEDSTFTKHVEENRDICSNCYRLLRRQVEPHESLPKVASDQYEYEDHVSFGYFDDKHRTGRPSAKLSYCECGFVDDGKTRPLDKDQMMEVAYRVEERLSEKEIRHDEDVFFDVVRKQKSDPDMQFNEELILEEATERSISACKGV